jgi:hypothetical protein
MLLVYRISGTAMGQDPLIVEPNFLNLGDIWETKEFPFKIPVKNQSAKAVEVANLVSSCSCVGIEPRAFDLQPGETREVSLLLDLSKASLQGDEGADVRQFEAEILPIMKNGLTARASWVIRADVRSSFRITPRFIDFGSEVIRDKLPSAAFDVSCLRDVKDFAANGKGLSVQISKGSSPDSLPKYKVLVTPNASLPTGRLETFAVFSAEIPGQGKVVKEAPVVGRLFDEVYCLPDVLCLGAVSVGQSAEDVILLRSRNDQKFEIVGIDVDTLSGLSVTPAASSAGSRQFRVVQKCSEVGLRRSEVRFTVQREGKSGPDTITLPVVHQGIPRT